MTPWYTDQEIDDLCCGLINNAAKARYLRGMGLTVTQKPNGRPLVMRGHAELVLSGLRHGLSAMLKRSIGKVNQARKQQGLQQIPSFGFRDLKGKGATDMWQAGIPIEQIQQLCGHEDKTTTEIYVKHADLCALVTERRDLMPHHDDVWVFDSNVGVVQPCHNRIIPAQAYIARCLFLDRYRELTDPQWVPARRETDWSAA